MEKIKAKVIQREIDGEKVQILEMGFPAQLKVVGEDDEKWIVEGYASVFGNIDSYYEVVDKGAFKEWLEANFPRYPKFIWAHDWTRPLGPTLEAREDEIGLFVRGELLKDVQDAKEAYSLIKSGAMTDLSFGFRVDQDELDQATGVRHLKKISIYEWSPVLVGANPKATITKVKDAQGTTEGDQETPAAGDPPAPTDPETPVPPAAADEAAGGTTEETPAGGDAPAAGQESAAAPTEEKAGRVLSAKNRKIVEAAIEAVANASTALEALLEAADESESASSETEVEQREGKGDRVAIRGILRDARRADKIIEKVILRAKNV